MRVKSLGLSVVGTICIGTLQGEMKWSYLFIGNWPKWLVIGTCDRQKRSNGTSRAEAAFNRAGTRDS